ncbi:MAG TPA: hypothetical protein VLY45_05465 [Nitrospiria bacterium]|nr:hypothetical protein [Nitrospiria bacterium]
MKIGFFTVCLLVVIFRSPASAGDSSYEASIGLIQPNGFVIYYDSQGPLSYRTLTLKDLPAGFSLLGEVRASDCQHAVSIPLNLIFREGVTVSGAQGDGGFKKAMATLRRKYPHLDGMFDVKIDVQELIILGLYTRQCTEIVARGFHVLEPPAALELIQPDESAAGHDVH